jgi:hypothetical protein
MEQLKYVGGQLCMLSSSEVKKGKDIPATGREGP